MFSNKSENNSIQYVVNNAFNKGMKQEINADQNCVHQCLLTSRNAQIMHK